MNVNRGEFLSLVGPSGCGKSTLLNILAGLSSVSSGDVVWNTHGVGARQDIAYVFQQPTLMPWRTVGHNVALPLELVKVSKKEKINRVREALNLVGLLESIDLYPRQLSGGMAARVAIARALVSRPEILLMDEPFAAVDEITRQSLQDNLLEIWARERLTVVFVTHNVFEAVYLSSRVVVLKGHPGIVVLSHGVDAPPSRQTFRSTRDFGHQVALVLERLKMEHTNESNRIY